MIFCSIQSFIIFHGNFSYILQKTTQNNILLFQNILQKHININNFIFIRIIDLIIFDKNYWININNIIIIYYNGLKIIFQLFFHERKRKKRIIFGYNPGYINIIRIRI